MAVPSSILAVSPGSLFRRRELLVSLGLASLGGIACASTPPHVWYTALPRSEWGAQPPEYVIGVGDVLVIRVYEQDTLGGSVKVRSDGRVTLALIGEAVAVGKHPSAFSRELEGLFKRFIVSPRVTVNVEQAQPVQITVLGEARTAGQLLLEPPPLLLQALARAGGLTEFADEKSIYVIRQFPAFRRIRFTYDAILNNEHGAAGFVLRTGDVIVID
jgi:polysaccharide export outer membrane protein